MLTALFKFLFALTGSAEIVSISEGRAALSELPPKNVQKNVYLIKIF